MNNHFSMIFEYVEFIFDVLKLIWEKIKAQIYIYKWHFPYILAI